MRRFLNCLSLSCLFQIAVLISPVTGQETIQPATGNPTASASSRMNSGITFKDGRLSANFQDLPLARLSDELSQKAGVAIVLVDDVEDQKVSAKFNDLALDEALRQILRKQDAFFFYGVDENRPAALKAVWIYAKGHGRGVAPVSAEKWASTKDIASQLSDKDPEIRTHAIKALIDRKQQGAMPELLTALKDGSDQVRSEALYAAADSGVVVPESTLKDLAAHDSSSDVRFLALQALSDSPDARSMANAALNDPSEAVRNKAQEILGRLDPHANEPRESPQSLDHQ
jgi:HEAT repeats